MDLEFDKCLLQVAKLRYETLDVMKSLKILPYSEVNNCRADAQRLVRQAEVIDCALNDWAEALPQQWTYKVHKTTKPLSYDMSYNGTLYLYPNKEHATNWNRYRGARLITNSIIIKLLDHFAHSLGLEELAQINFAKRNIQTFVNDICATVAFCLGRVIDAEPPIVLDKDTNETIKNVNPRQAFLLQWPLIIASALSSISEHQRRWIRPQLMLIGHITGSGMLQSLASGK